MGGGLLPLCGVFLISCATVPRRSESTRKPAAIVCSERGPRGARLVAVDNGGRRLWALTRPSTGAQFDVSPVFSPDGQWIVFVSTRGQPSVTARSLWAVSSRGGTPHQVTWGEGDTIDRDPRVAPDGRSIVFSSNRGGQYQLYRLPVTISNDGVRATGAPVVLTRDDRAALGPTIGADGKIVVYMASSKLGNSSLWSVPLAGGQPRQLTGDAIDLTPALAPNGSLVFASPTVSGDVDLFALDLQDGSRSALVRGAFSDETGPVWSPDGRFLFATALLRSEVDGRGLFASIVFVDLNEAPRVYRALHEPGAVEARIGVALSPTAFSPSGLHQNGLYEDEIRRLLQQKLGDEHEGAGSSSPQP